MRISSIVRWNDYHNMPKKFIDRFKFSGTVIDSNYRIRGPRAINFLKNYTYGRHAPWTAEAMAENLPKKKRIPIIVVPMKDWPFFRGDRVEILVGSDAGKQGSVSGIVRERNWVFVSGLNTKFIGRGGDGTFPFSCFWEEQPLCVTREVRLVDPYDNKQCEVEWRFTGDGNRVRVSKRSGRIIPMPEQAFETVDYVKKSLYAAGDKDTKPEQLKERTFVPTDKSFYQSMMEIHGIDEKRVRGRVYTY